LKAKEQAERLKRLFSMGWSISFDGKTEDGYRFDLVFTVSRDGDDRSEAVKKAIEFAEAMTPF